MFERDRYRRLAGVRQLAGQHLIEHDAEAVEIGRFVHFVLLRLLRRDVVDAAHHQPRLGQRHRLLRDGARDAEVGELDDVVFGDEDVGRLDIAMEQTLAVCVGEAACDLRRVVDRDRLGEAAVSRDDLGERRAVDQFHHDEVRIVLVADVEGVDDVGMRELCGRFGLLVEAANELVVGGVLFAQHFDRDAPAQQDIGAAVDRRHAAFAELAVEPVAIVEDALFDQLPVLSNAVRSTSRAIGAAYVAP